MSAHKIFSGVLQPSITAKWFNKPIQAWKHRCCLRNVMQSIIFWCPKYPINQKWMQNETPPKQNRKKKKIKKNTKWVHIRFSWVKVQQMIYAITSVLVCYFSFPVTFTLTWFDLKMKMISFQNRFPSIQIAREGTHTSRTSCTCDLIKQRH